MKKTEPAPARVVTLDVETGQWLPGSASITQEEGVRLAASLLPGTPIEAVRKLVDA